MSTHGSRRKKAHLSRRIVTTFDVRILDNDHHPASHKLADVEIHFTGGDLDGLTLAGFAVWVDSAGMGETVTFSSRQFCVRGQSSAFSLGRWIAKREAQERLAAVVVRAYRRHRRRTMDRSLRSSRGFRRLGVAS
jgi:hypothetical protein